MNKFYYFLLTVLGVGILTTSCKKDDENAASNIIGSWNATTIAVSFTVNGVNVTELGEEYADYVDFAGEESVVSDKMRLIIYDNFTLEKYEDTTLIGSGTWSMIGDKIFKTVEDGEKTNFIIEDLSKSSLKITTGDPEEFVLNDSTAPTVYSITTSTFTK